MGPYNAIAAIIPVKYVMESSKPIAYNVFKTKYIIDNCNLIKIILVPAKKNILKMGIFYAKLATTPALIVLDCFLTIAVLVIKI